MDENSNFFEIKNNELDVSELINGIRRVDREIAALMLRHNVITVNQFLQLSGCSRSMLRHYLRPTVDQRTNKIVQPILTRVEPFFELREDDKENRGRTTFIQVNEECIALLKKCNRVG